MNTPIRNLSILALAVGLPLAVTAQSGSSGSSSASSSSPSSSSSGLSGSGSSGSSGMSSSGSGSSSSRMSGGSGGTSSSSMSSQGGSSSSRSGGLAQIQRVSDSSLNQQFTAKRLIGQDVYDNSNKKVGEIRDVVLDSNGAQRLAGAMGSSHSWGSGQSGSSTGAQGSAGIGATGAGASGSVSAGGATASGSLGSGSGASGSLSGGSGLSGSSLAGMAGLSSEPAVIVSYDRASGSGGNLLRVPLSQLNYDSSSQHIRLDIGQDQLSSLPSASDSSRSAAE